MAIGSSRLEQPVAELRPCFQSSAAHNGVHGAIACMNAHRIARSALTPTSLAPRSAHFRVQQRRTSQGSST
jgi:hypothetical protein